MSDENITIADCIAFAKEKQYGQFRHVLAWKKARERLFDDAVKETMVKYRGAFEELAKR